MKRMAKEENKEVPREETPINQLVVEKDELQQEELKEDKKVYSIVTDDYLQRGTGYPSLKVKDEVCHYDHGFIRHVIERHLMDEDLFHQVKNLKV